MLALATAVRAPARARGSTRTRPAPHRRSSTVGAASSPLSRALPGAQLGEHHSGIVDAPVGAVWDALHALRWADLVVGRPLLALRGLAGALRKDRILETFTLRAGAALVEEAPLSSMLVMIGRPWSPVPTHVPVETLDAAAEFRAPGWLTYGMEWVLHPLPDGRTLVETRTICRATDAKARLAFGVYWAVIRAGSAAIRLDMIAALRRLSAGHVIAAGD